MGLDKARLGDYIEVSTENNSSLGFGHELIRGVTTVGKIAEPKGDTNGVNLKPYKIVKKNAFVYNPSRLDLGSIALSDEELCLVSHLYIVFYLNNKGLHSIDPEWLYMYFRRPEFCREVTFRNFGSQRPEFNFKKLSDIEIPLPPIDIQREFAAIYESMLDNQRSYEQGLNDLKLACDLLLEQCKHGAAHVTLGEVFKEVDNRNVDLSCTVAHGLNIEKRFMLSKASADDLKRYKLVKPGQFAYSSMQTGRDKCIRISLNKEAEPLAVSPAYSVLECENANLLPEFVMMWMSRAEVDRLGWFCSDGSIRANLDLERLYEIEIPNPDMKMQKSIAEIYAVLQKRLLINNRLKSQLKEICPVLIRGSIEEASR